MNPISSGEAVRLLTSSNIKHLLWLSSDKAITLGANIVLTALVARTLGPEAYGLLLYITSISTILVTVATFGLDDILVTKIVGLTQKSDYINVLGAAFALRLICSFLAGVLSIACVVNLLPNNREALLVAIINCLFYVAVILDIPRAWYLAQKCARPIARATIVGTLVASSAKLFLVFRGATLIPFAFASVLSSLAPTFFLSCHFFARGLPGRFSQERVLFYVRELSRLGTPRVLSMLAGSVVVNFPLLLVGHGLSEQAVGEYGVAYRLVGFSLVLVGVVQQGLLPSLLDTSRDPRRFEQTLTNFYKMIFVGGIVLAFGIAFAGSLLILLVYGDEFRQSLFYLYGLCLFVPLWCLGQARNTYILVNEAHLYNLVALIVQAVVGMMLMLTGFWLGSIWGLIVSFGITQAFSCLFLDRLLRVHSGNSEAAARAVASLVFIR